MLYYESPQLAIYDECYVCAQALHNSFKKLGFTIHALSRNESELLQFILLKPTVLIFHLDYSVDAAYNLLIKLKAVSPRLKVLAHTIRKEPGHVEMLRKSGADLIVHGDYDFNSLVDMLMKLEKTFGSISEGQVDIDLLFKLNVNDPFYKIASDPRKLGITRLIAAGKSTKAIAHIFESTESDIEMIRKKILHETHCQTMAEYIGKAKDKKIV